MFIEIAINGLKWCSISKKAPFNLRIVAPLIEFIRRGILHAGVLLEILSINIVHASVVDTSKPNVE